MTTKILARWMLCALFVVVACLPARAAPPQTISYQGFLTSSTGVPVNTTVSVQFSLYTVASGGIPLWTETQNVPVANGNYSVVLGNLTPFGLPFDAPYFLGVKVGADAEMAPRAALATAPYAFRAINADTATTANTAASATTAATATTAAIANALSGSATVAGSQITGAITGATVPAGQISAGTAAINITGNAATATTATAAATATTALSADTATTATTAATANALSGGATVTGSQITGAITGATIPAGQISAGTASIDITGNAATATSFTGSVQPSQIATGDISANNISLNNPGGIIYRNGQIFLHDSSNNTFLGVTAGNLTLSGSGNIGIGRNALSSITTGGNNAALGAGALSAGTTASNSVAVGEAALNQATGDSNIALGSSAGLFLTSGNQNIMIGNFGQAADSAVTRIGAGQTQAFIAGIHSVTPAGGSVLPVVIDSAGQLGTTSSLSVDGSAITGSITTATVPGSQVAGTIAAAAPGSQSVAVGTGALQSNSSFGNTAVGFNAMTSTTSAQTSVAVGHNALASLTDGKNNTAVGAGALATNQSSEASVAIGTSALANSTGGDHVAVGKDALLNNTTATENTAVGAHSMINNMTGPQNTALGYRALENNQTGQRNIALGYNAGNAIDGSFNIAIGNPGVPGESNTTWIGNNQNRTFISGVRGITPAQPDGLPVIIDSQGQLGTTSSLAIDGSGITGSITVATIPAAQISAGTAAIDISGNAATATAATTAATATTADALSGSATIAGSQITGDITVQSNISLPSTNAAGTAGILFAGGQRFISTLGPNNTFVGPNAGNLTLLEMAATSNTAIGASSLSGLTFGSNNTALGYIALSGITTGGSNVGIGSNAGSNWTTTSNNIAIATPGDGSDSGAIRIGHLGTHSSAFIQGIRGTTVGDALPVVIDPNGQLGSASSLSGSLVSGSLSAATIDWTQITNIPPSIADGDDVGVYTAGSGLSLTGNEFSVGANLSVTTLSASTLVDAGVYNLGGQQFIHGPGSGNAFVGLFAGNASAGAYNTGVGHSALSAVNGGGQNTAVGRNALVVNTSGNFNNAVGDSALSSNTIGGDNTAVGFGALAGAITSIRNTAFGNLAGVNLVSGDNNLMIGFGAGSFRTTGSNNIIIGNDGVTGEESNAIRIGTDGTHTATYIAGIYNSAPVEGQNLFVDSSGRLGTSSSSARFKEDIRDMDAASANLMALRPVVFRYKPEISNGSSVLQYGLIAEEVEKVYPGLVVRNSDGKVQAVRYQFLAPMLLNEYQKQQHTIEAQASQLETQTARIAELEQDRQTQTARIEALEQQATEIAELKRQAARMSAALERIEGVQRVAAGQ